MKIIIIILILASVYSVIKYIYIKDKCEELRKFCIKKIDEKMSYADKYRSLRKDVYGFYIKLMKNPSTRNIGIELKKLL